MTRRITAAAVLAAAVLLTPAAVTATAQTPPTRYEAPKSCTLSTGLCHVNHPLGVVPSTAHCQPRVYAGGRAWTCSIVELTSTGVTVQANNVDDGSPRAGSVRFYLEVTP